MDFVQCPRGLQPGMIEPREAAVACAVRSGLVLLVILFAVGTSGCGKSPEEQKAAAAEHKAQTTGRLVVKSNHANTTVEATRLPTGSETSPASVNGVTDGALEHTLSGLPPGKYSVMARSDGWPELKQETNVSAGQTTEVAVNFKSGSLRLNSDPTGATVRLGANTLGQTPLVIPQLPLGECKLTLAYPSWPAVTFQTTITENVEATATVRLPHGKLTVQTTPPGATVLLGGRAVGQTPLTLERVSAGTRKLTLQAKDFPALELSVTVEDRGEVKISPALGSAFPVLDPEALLRAVWVPDDPNRLAPPLEGLNGPFQSQNGIVKNLNRKRVYEVWLRKQYCFTGAVKAYDPASGQIEFAEQKGELCRYRVLAKLTPAARSNRELSALLTKGATFALYGRLTAVEEPRWPSKMITFEISSVEPLR